MNFISRIFGRKDQIPQVIPTPTIDELKQRTRILFIDDKRFPVVDILKKNGWVNTDLIKDVDNLDDPKIKDSHLIFIDIHGVGRSMSFADEGLGLVKAIKYRFPEKRVAVYSAEPEGDLFNDGIVMADARIKKNADPIQFLTTVEKFSEGSFSPDACSLRLQAMLRDDFGVYLDKDEILNKIAKIKARGDVTEKGIGKIFNVDRAGSIASIISLLLS